MGVNQQNVWDTEHFAFTLDFQRQILVTLLQNKDIFDRIGSYISYKYFENKDLARIYKNILEFHEKYKGFPNCDSLKEFVTDNYGENQVLAETVDDLYSAKRISKENVEFVESSLSNFIQCQALKKAIVESIDDLGDVDKHEGIKGRIEDALAIATKIEDLGTDAYTKESIIERIRDRRENVDIVRLPFGWENMDLAFGGLGEGEIFSFIGPAHSGKSMFLINVGVNQLIQKKNVLHISLEMSEKITVQRYDMSLLGLTKADLKTNRMVEEIKEKLRDKIGRLWVKQFPSDVTTPTEIGRFMNRLASSKDFVPDVLIVDYADIMSSPSKYHEKRHELGAIYRALRNLGVEYKIPICTATQMNRGSLIKLESGKLLDESDIAESYDIMRILDTAVSINSSVEDRHNNRAILYVVKNRDGDIGQKIAFYIDWSKAYAKER